jgi:hypothetical protein
MNKFIITKISDTKDNITECLIPFENKKELLAIIQSISSERSLKIFNMETLNRYIVLDTVNFEEKLYLNIQRITDDVLDSDLELLLI